jgi:hypothetical protein
VTATKHTIGIRKRTPNYDVWELTVDGNFIGDQRGVRRDQIVAVAVKAARDWSWEQEAYEVDPTLLNEVR